MTADSLVPHHDERFADDEAHHLRFLLRRKPTHRRIDRYLHGRLADEFSRSGLQQLIRAGLVTVNGRSVKPSYGLNVGDTIDAILPPPVSDEIIAEPIPLTIIFEDEHLLVLNKPADLVVHPARGNQSGTLVNGLAYYSESLSSGSDAFRPGIVHRLDKNTTGVIVVAKTDLAHARVARQFEQRQVQKQYLAVVDGVLELQSDWIELPVGRHPTVRERYAVRPADGRAARTFYEVSERFDGFTLLRLSPYTGRSHQLRVHMAHLGHSITGDTIYGGKAVTAAILSRGAETDSDPLIQRQALHAWKLTVRHPETNAPMTFMADPPEDLQALIAAVRRWRGRANGG